MLRSVLCLVCTAALFCCLALTGCAEQQGLASTGEDSEPTTTVPEGAKPGPSPGPSDNASQATGSFSFSLESTEWVTAEDEAIVVRVFGQSTTGERIDQQYTAAPGHEYLVPVGPGDYEVSLLTGVPVKGHRLFKAQAQRTSFDGTKDENLALTLTLDTDSMKNRQTNPSDGQKTKLPGSM